MVTKINACVSFFAITFTILSLHIVLADANTSKGLCKRKNAASSIELFKCPQQGQPADWISCCGNVSDVKGQYCCSDTRIGVDNVKHHPRNIRNATVSRSRSRSRSYGTIFGMILKSIGFEAAKLVLPELVQTHVNEPHQVIPVKPVISLPKLPGNFIALLERTDPVLAQEVSQSIQKTSNTLLRVHDNLKNSNEDMHIVWEDFKRECDELEEKFNLGAISVTDVAKELLQKTMTLLRNVDPTAAEEIKEPLDKVIDTIKKHVLKNFAAIQVPSWKTLATLLFVLSSLHRLLFH